MHKKTVIEDRRRELTEEEILQIKKEYAKLEDSEMEI